MLFFRRIAVVSLVVALAACSRSKPPAPATRFRVDAPAMNQGNRVLLLPVDSRFAILGKCSQKQKEKIHDGSLRTGAVLTSVLPDYLKARGYEATHFMTWSGQGTDNDRHIVSFLPARNVAAMVYSLAHFARGIDASPLHHVVDPADFRPLAEHADYTLYTASWSVVDFQRKKKESVAKTLLYTGAIVLAVAVIAVSILAIAGGKDGANAVAKGLEAGGRILVYAGRGFVRVLTRVPARAVIKGLSRAALNTARVSARVATRVTLDGSVHVEIPIDQVEEIPMEVPPAESVPEPEPLEPEEKSPENPDTLQPDSMTNRYLGIFQGLSSLQPPQSTAGYQMVLVLVNNHTGRVVWDARLFIPQNAPQGNLQMQLESLFRSLPAAPQFRLSVPYVR